MIRHIFLFLALMSIALPALAAMDHMSTPLMVIRFNQPRVYYDQPLYGALTRAIEAKPSVHFHIINYYPVQPRAQQIAAQKFSRVMTSIKQMGMPDSRMSIRQEPAPDLNYSEVHIYVR